ncbi:type II glyceraldehyde-3-phosphate dehydrogenase [Candidatus Woesearchaeota archaeon]|nr:type II glyceraldehyde-3-phosphate dehydrogenase [Candidatus Woesearchaeota archaeon]|tara:strand:+ start:10216 stop:11229 length:1014 start_codon:yes stop_codon:yes gene_type:complete
MDKIKVGVVGYGTIGKRVADAVMLQEDMELIGITGHRYSYRMLIANEKNIPIYALDGVEDFIKNNVHIAGRIEDMLKKVDIIVDCTPKKIGKENKEKYYKPNKLKAIFQGGEKPDVADCSFVAQCNYDEAVGKDYIRVVSCNTTGLSRTLDAVNKKFGIKEVHATMIRRGADTWDIYHGPINAIVPVLELPSHHGPDVKTVLKDINIFTTAISVSTTLMHMHNVIVECQKEPTVEEALDLFKNTSRVRIVDNASGVRSTAQIIEFARDLGRNRGDMPEIVIWKEGIGVANHHKLLYMQAVHQESDVIPENIDAIRAAMGFKDGKKSIEMTNKSFGIE